MTPSRPALALSALISGALVISLAPIFVKTSEVGPSATAFHRMFLSLPIFIIAHCALAHTAYHETADKWDVRTYALLTLAGGFFAGSLAVLHWSIELTTVANATLLGNASPIFVAIVAWILLGETIGTRFILGLAIAIVGTVLVVNASFSGHGNILGDTLALVTACLYAGYVISVKLLRRSVATLDIMMWSGLTAAPILLIIALLSGETLTPMTVAGWLVLAGLALISHAIGQSLIAFSLATLTASSSSLTLLIQPVGATILAWVILGEELKVQQAFGGVAVLIGILLARQQNPTRD